MIIANKYEIPDTCPSNCPHKNNKFSQGDLCRCCPVFSCYKIKTNDEYGDENGMFCLIEAKDYREDWAKIWSEWFKGDMKKYPELPLKRREE